MTLDAVHDDPLVSSKGLIPRFYKRKRTINLATKHDPANGDVIAREEKVIEDDWVEIIIAGDNLAKPTLKVTDQIKAMFPDYWLAYQAGSSSPIGTPLGIHFDEATVAKLHVLNIRTLESLASLSSHAQDQLPGGRVLVAQAQRIVNGQAAAAERAKSQALESQVQSLSEQLAAVQETLQQLAAQGEKNKGGRPTNAEREARQTQAA